jgi:tetratricopeptide (TPR) repeat protein
MRIAVVTLLGMLACSAPPQADNNDSVTFNSRDSALYYFDRIDSGRATFDELERARKYFIEEDSLVVGDAKRLMQAGLVLMAGNEDYLYGVNYLIKLTKKYPRHPFAPEALMQLALFFENTLGDVERSQMYLREIIKRYPENPLAVQAETLLKLSGDEQYNTIQNWLNKE